MSDGVKNVDFSLFKDFHVTESSCSSGQRLSILRIRGFSIRPVSMCSPVLSASSPRQPSAQNRGNCRTILRGEPHNGCKVDPYQNTYFAANCRMRGFPAPRIVPKLETLSPLEGLLKFT